MAAGAAAVLDPKVKVEGAGCFASACFPNWKAPGAALAVVPAVVPPNWKAAPVAAGAWGAAPNENTLPLLAVVVVVAEAAVAVEIGAGAAPNEKLAAFGGAAAPNVNAGAPAVAPTVPAAGATWPNENSGGAAEAAPKVNAGLWEGAPPAPVPNWKAAVTGAAAVVTGTAAGTDVVTEPKSEGAGATDATEVVPKANGAALLTGAAGGPPKLKLTCLAVVSGAADAGSPPLSLAAGCEIAVAVAVLPVPN